MIDLLMTFNHISALVSGGGFCVAVHFFVHVFQVWKITSFVISGVGKLHGATGGTDTVRGRLWGGQGR